MSIKTHALYFVGEDLRPSYSYSGLFFYTQSAIKANHS